ncbi:MAG: spermidine synthase [Marmoricola sp.]|jgi:spermidine synthase|nr:spermidine synthase [Marmoricola sp.]
MEYVEIGRASSERGEVVLRERRADAGPAVLELRVNGVFVMDTCETTSERALARHSLALVDDPRTVLLGGLGLGFTAHELLSDPRVERVDVVELEEAIIGWMRDGTITHGPALLADRRINVINADIAIAIAETPGPTYDLVLLDVDNGPGYLVQATNAAVYERAFLARCAAALQLGGAVAVWSANDAPELQQTLIEVFGACERTACPVRLQHRDEEYLLYHSRVAGQ